VNPSDDLHIRIWARIKGHVQGVGFRAFTADVAQNLDLSGWVRNDSDGSVECEAQGPKETLEQFIINLQQGPCFSKVQGVEHHQRPTVRQEKAFHIRH
jgi:acylphosphatase